MPLKTEVMMLKIQLCFRIHFIFKYIKQETNIRNCNNVSQYYSFCLYFDQINTALMSRRASIKKTRSINIPMKCSLHNTPVCDCI